MIISVRFESADLLPAVPLYIRRLCHLLLYGPPMVTFSGRPLPDRLHVYRSTDAVCTFCLFHRSCGLKGLVLVVSPVCGVKFTTPPQASIIQHKRPKLFSDLSRLCDRNSWHVVSSVAVGSGSAPLQSRCSSSAGVVCISCPFLCIRL